MINLQSFNELEALIRDGHHRKARHLIRDMLAEIKQHFIEVDEQASVVKGLLSDTLDMLLGFTHESQISLNAIRAARLLAKGQSYVSSDSVVPHWQNTCW